MERQDRDTAEKAADTTATPASGREPYVKPVIEKFPPMTEVAFAASIHPDAAGVLFQ
jgi:hypothetical protein